MSLDLNGRTAIVTGASKGIGLAVAHGLAQAGANVVLCARNADDLARAHEQVEGVARGRVLAEQCDMQVLEQVHRLVDRTVKELGGVDVLVNNAGVGSFAPIDAMPVEDWNRIIGTNLSGVFYASQAAIPHMKQRGGGYIINIGSLAGKNPMPGGTAYNASKFGLLGMSEAMMLDVRHHGIRVTCVMPGSVATHFNDHTPSEADAWKIQPEDISRIVLDLLAMPERTLPSRVEVRPTQPPRK